MKPLRSILLAVLLALVPLICFAVSRKSINVPEAVKVGDVMLQPGDYKVEWQGSGPAVQVSFVQNNKTVTTAPATLQNKDTGFDGALDLNSAHAGETKSLHAIEFKHMLLIFDQTASASSPQ